MLSCWVKVVFVLSSSSTVASWGGRLRPQRRGPGRRLRQRRVMSPIAEGSDPARLGWIRSGPVRPASPLLWTNGRPRPPSYWNIPEKTHERHLQFLTTSLSVTRGNRREGGLRVPAVNSASHTCWTLERCGVFIRPLPAEERREEVLNVAFQTSFPLSPLQPLFEHLS